jgi:transglutaminase-like putative cysteine protease
MRYRVRHLTEYTYQNTIYKGLNRAHILPSSIQGQNIINQIVEITPPPNSCTTSTDTYGNNFLYFVINEPHQSLKIDVISDIEIDYFAEFVMSDLSVSEALSYFNSNRCFSPEIEEFLGDSPLIPLSIEATALAAPFFTNQKNCFVGCLKNFTEHVFDQFEYSPGFSSVSTPIEEVLTHKKGVCQDFAHLSIAALRGLGIPARYVSGYLETEPPPGQEKLIGADASHAWYEVLIPDKGWIGFDPTNNKLAGNQHIITARGRDYADLPPLQGIFFGNVGEQSMLVSVDVRKIDSEITTKSC